MKSPASVASDGPEKNGRSTSAYPAEQSWVGPPGVELREACAADLAELMRLERLCFEDWRQDSRRAIRKALCDAGREVWVLTTVGGEGLLAALFLRHSRAGLRIYSLVTDPAHRSRGLGGCLMRFSLERASALGADFLTLEADAAQPELLSWYERRGFGKVALLNDFYGPGHHAWRMARKVTDPS